MSWWDEIQEKINSGDVLYTPGRGLQRIGKKSFSEECGTSLNTKIT